MGRPSVFLDSTPNYMFAPTVAPRIQQAIPDARFIIVLRVRCFFTKHLHSSYAPRHLRAY